MILLEKEYNAESLVDLEEDVRWAIESIDAPVDEHGFFEGEVHVYMEYKPLSEEWIMIDVEGSSEDMLMKENLELHNKLKSIKNFLKPIIEKEYDPVFTEDVDAGIIIGQKQLSETILNMLE